jgi:hypothetical protein
MGSLSTIANAEQAERTDVQARTAERARVFTSNPLYATNAGFKAAADAIIAMPESDIMAARDRAAATLGANIDHSTLSLEAQRAAGTIENLQALQHAENTQAPSPAITKALLSEVISLGQQLAHYNPLDVETPSQQQIADAIDRRLAAKGNAPSK